MITRPRISAIGGKQGVFMKLILVRHGESASNVDNGILLEKDFFDHQVKLTEKGISQAKEAGERIDRENLLKKENLQEDRCFVYFSPYERTRETKNNLLSALKENHDDIIFKEIEHPLIREQEFKDFKTREEMDLKRTRRMVRGKFYYRYKNAEAPSDVYLRAVTFLNELRLKHKEGDRIIIVSHEVVLRCLLHNLFHLTVEDHEEVHLMNCEINVIDNLNFDAHLVYSENKSLIKEYYNEECSSSSKGKGTNS